MKKANRVAYVASEVLSRMHFLRAGIGVIAGGLMVRLGLPESGPSPDAIGDLEPDHVLADGEMVDFEQQAIDDQAFVILTDIQGDRGELMRIDMDGQLVFGEGVEPKEAAKQFAHWVNEITSGRVKIEDYTA